MLSTYERIKDKPVDLNQGELLCLMVGVANILRDCGEFDKLQHRTFVRAVTAAFNSYAEDPKGARAIIGKVAKNMERRIAKRKESVDAETARRKEVFEKIQELFDQL